MRIIDNILKTIVNPKSKPDLFAQKMAAKKANAHGTYKMVCPFCLDEFEVWEMPFRAFTEQDMTVNMAGAGSFTPPPVNGQVDYYDPQDDFKDDYEDQQSAVGGACYPSESEFMSEPMMGFEESSGTCFPPELDQKHEAFLKRMNIKKAHNHYRGRVLTTFEYSENGEGKYVGDGIQAVMPFGSTEWINVSPRSEASAAKIRHKPIAYIRDQFGNESDQRLCPHCHNTMPDKAGQLPNYVVMLLGDTNSGKTVYKIRLLHELDTHGLLNGTVRTGTFFCRNAADGVAAPSIQTLWRESFKKAYKKKHTRIADPTKVDYIDPYTITLFKGETEVALLTVYDFPGEAIHFSKAGERADYVKSIRQRMRVVDGIMFLLDLTTVDFLRDNLEEEYTTDTARQERDADFEEPSTPEEIVGLFLDNYLPIEMGASVAVPICYMFSKADLLEMAIERCRQAMDKEDNSEELTADDLRWLEVDQICDNLSQLKLPPVCVTNRVDQYRAAMASRTRSTSELRQIVEEYKSKHTAVDIDDIVQSDEELGALLGDYLESAMAKSPKGLRFAVSAVGAPISSAADYVEEADPVRVMEPLEYLLWQMGLVDHAEPENESNISRIKKLKG